MNGMMKQSAGVSVKPELKTKLAWTVAAFALLSVLMIILFLYFAANPGESRAGDNDYNSAASGSWTDVATWQGSVPPTTGINGDIITINSGHTVSMIGDINVNNNATTTNNNNSNNNGNSSNSNNPPNPSGMATAPSNGPAGNRQSTGAQMSSAASDNGSGAPDRAQSSDHDVAMGGVQSGLNSQGSLSASNSRKRQSVDGVEYPRRRATIAVSYPMTLYAIHH